MRQTHERAPRSTDGAGNTTDDGGPAATPARRGRGLGIAAAVAAALVLGGLAVWAILAAEEGTSGPDRGVSIDDIAEDPRAFADETVTVSGDVAETEIAPGVFTIGADGRLVVLPREGASVPESIGRGDPVQVRGAVALLSTDLADQEEFAFDEGAFFSGESFGLWEGRPAIMASSVDTSVPDETEE